MTPVLYAPDGAEYQLPPLTLAPAGVRSIDIRAALSAAPDPIRAHFSDYGSAAVKYAWYWHGAAGAMIQNQAAKRSLNFNFELRTSMHMQQRHASETIREGLWWREDSGVKGFLALVNVTQRPVDAQVQVLSEYGAFHGERMVHLDANGTRILEVPGNDEGSSGGIRVSYQGSENDIVLAGGLENPREGYSARIPFVTATTEAKPSEISVSSTGLMLGAADPMMNFPSGTTFGVYLALRNTLPRPTLVTPTLYCMHGGEVIKSTLKPIALAAWQARHWTPEELANDLGFPSLSGMQCPPTLLSLTILRHQSTLFLIRDHPRNPQPTKFRIFFQVPYTPTPLFSHSSKNYRGGGYSIHFHPQVLL